MEAEKIMNIAKEIISSSLKANSKKVHFEKKFPDFAEKYPTLFNKCCETSDITTIQYVLNMLLNIEQNKMTQETATANVGQKLFDEYVKPYVDESALTPK